MRYLLGFLLVFACHGYGAAASGTVFLLNFEEASGNALDSSGNGYNFTLTGTSPPDRPTSPTAPQGTQWLGNQTTTSQHNAPAGALTAMSAKAYWSFEWYSYVVSSGSNPTWMTNGALTFWVQYGSPGGGVYAIRMQSAAGPTVYFSTGLTYSTSRHHAYTYDGTNIKLYIDGVLKQTTAGSYTTPTLADFRIGGAFALLDGYTDQVRFRTYASAGEVPTTFPTIDPAPSTGNRGLRLINGNRLILGLFDLFSTPLYAIEQNGPLASKIYRQRAVSESAVLTRTRATRTAIPTVRQMSVTPTPSITPAAIATITPTPRSR